MIIVIGLGNIGSKYRGHRHNVGFQVLDALAEKESLCFEEKSIFHCDLTQFGELLLAKPTTFMNESGKAAQTLLRQYNAPLVVVYDDIDISLGTVKCSFGRGAGGHNGVQSIIDHVGHKDFFRIRIGIRPVHEELMSRIAPPNGFETFMLSDFAPFEEEERDKAIEKTIKIIEMLPHKSFDEIMNLQN
jgi:peptidyl-tRNA hydrolase, PTH1 family